MKRISFVPFFLTLTAVFGFVSCSKQEIETPMQNGDEICFSIASTKAADITTANIQRFSVTAYKGEGHTLYFKDVEFLKTVSGTFTSAVKYYWPSDETLTFEAFAPCDKNSLSTQVRKETSDYTHTIVPDTTLNSSTQVDFIVAHHENMTKTENGAIPLVFKHAESKIIVKVKNSSPALSMEVEGWRIGGIYRKGSFKFNGFDPLGFLNASSWGNTDSLNVFTQQLSKARRVKLNGVSTPKGVGNNLILIPQTGNKATAFDGNSGVFLSIKAIIKNSTDGTILAGTSKEGIWCNWPIDINWVPGRSYTYVVDLASGGYDEPGNPILDENDVISFVDVEVRRWDEGDTRDEETITVLVPARDIKFSGEISITDTSKVVFTLGNLVYNMNTTAGATKWNFHKEQYDMMDRNISLENMKDINAVDDEWIDRFGWSSADGIHPWGAFYSDPVTDYATVNSKFVDWGSAIQDVNGLRTWTNSEMQYIFNGRSGKCTKVPGSEERYNFAQARINTRENVYVNGCIIFPDEFTLPEGITIPAINSAGACSLNTFSLEDWKALEEAGCVFLPLASGTRLPAQACYWTSEINESTSLALGECYCYSLGIQENQLLFSTAKAGMDNPVRLIKDVK